jgi:hypothetical protein
MWTEQCSFEKSGIAAFYCKPVLFGVACSGAEEESRTLDLNLGKVALYQLSYFRICIARSFSLHIMTET